MSSVACKVWSAEFRVQRVKCKVWSVECFAVSVSVCVYVCLCMEGRLRGGMGATFCHLAALSSAIEFLFWDHWETAVLGQILAGRPREVTGANFCHWRPLGRRLNFSSGIIRFGPNPGREVMGGHGRSREVTGGHGRLREGENGEKWRNGGKKVGENQIEGRKCQV